MASLLYINTGLDNSPYSCYTNPELWDQIEEEYVKDSCKLIGLSVECPLDIWYVMIDDCCSHLNF